MEGFLEMKINLPEDRELYKVLANAYRAEIKPTLGTVLQQCVITEYAYPGFDIDITRYLVPMQTNDKFVNMNESGCQVLAKLVSLLFLPLDNRMKIKVTEEYPELNPALETSIPIIDLSGKSTVIQVAKVDATKSPVFAPMKKDVGNIVNKALSLTVRASPATLSLFVHKGPTSFKNAEENESRLAQVLYAQPQFNHRGNISDDRYNAIVDTCYGKGNLDLVTHRTTVVPYSLGLSYKESTPDKTIPGRQRKRLLRTGKSEVVLLLLILMSSY